MKVQEHPVYTQLLALEISRRMPEVRLPRVGFRSDSDRAADRRETAELLASIEQRVYHVVSVLMDNEWHGRGVPSEMREQVLAERVSKQISELSPAQREYVKPHWLEESAKELELMIGEPNESRALAMGSPFAVHFRAMRQGEKFSPSWLDKGERWHFRPDVVFNDPVQALRFCTRWAETVSDADSLDAAIERWHTFSIEDKTI